RKRGEAGVSPLAAAVSAIVARRNRPDRGRARRRRRRAAAFYFGVAGVTRKGISSSTIGMPEPSGASVTKTERVCAKCGATVFADAPTKVWLASPTPSASGQENYRLRGFGVVTQK